MSYTSHKTVPQRFAGIAFVVGFHVIVVYLLASGLGGKVVKVAEHIIETKVVEEIQETPDEPPPPPPDLKEPPPFIPPPEISIAPDVSAAPTKAIRTVTNKVAPPPPPPKAVEVQPKPSKRNSTPSFPPTSRRLGEVGVVILQIFVTPDGRVGDVRLAKSSGFKRLDDAALKHVKRAWRYTPGTKDGKPAGMWITQPVRFVLN